MPRRTTTILLAAASLSALPTPSSSSEIYVFRSRPLVLAPAAASPGAVTPNPRRSRSRSRSPGRSRRDPASGLVGHRGAVATVSGPEAAYQVCTSADCSSAAGWASAPSAPLPAGAFVCVRVRSAAFGSAASGSLSVGATSATFTVTTRAMDSIPDPIDFPSVGGAEPNVVAASASLPVTGHDGVTLSMSGGAYQICQTVACSEMDGQPAVTATSAEIPSGTRVRLLATPPAFG